LAIAEFQGASPYDALAKAGFMDLDKLDGATTAFITLDACDGNLVRAMVPALEAASTGDHGPWAKLVESNVNLVDRLRAQGLENVNTRTDITWDDATLLFTSTIVLTSEGRALALGDGKSRERIGRFPYGDGSPITYMLEYMRPNSQHRAISQRMEMDQIHSLLSQLNHGLCDQHVGHTRYNEGNAGLDIRGYLTAEEVRTLRLGLAGRGWSVTADEPIDGGMRDASKNLIAVLRAAERRDVGVFLRSHS
jgi:hypothetical protein